ncbi:hypothetical protein RM844_24615 [Streptomyces sp. DSM 44915]|uniref:Uncharacterized protein n=1 Tax=Streptomyces chisholmiae TaxID=3075540 RepID=A0ABU2JWU7_9ACTN|nr:hypothetical protein [Streptomyces sp. DSM 44915]MDT0269470.1 hypothetical protein [Streptomyces sp. DSM 44915]
MQRHQVRIKATPGSPPGAAPETAALRLITLLPGQWSATLLSCTEDTATLALTRPRGTSQEASEAVDRTLGEAAMRGWVRDGEVRTPPDHPVNTWEGKRS